VLTSQAPDGTRVDSEGRPWVPPLDNGIKAAVDGLMPKQAALATGEVEKAGPANGEASMAAETTEAQTIAAEHSHGADVPTNAKAEAEGTKRIENGVAGLSVNGGEEATTTELPAVETKPGAPVGDSVFDHLPNEEKKQAGVIEARS
jgi:hypothetical protein